MAHRPAVGHRASGRKARLNDGRARTLEEVILRHGGEEEKARHALVAVSAAERAALVKLPKSP